MIRETDEIHRPASDPSSSQARWPGFAPGRTILAAASQHSSGGRPLTCAIQLDRDVEIALRDGTRIYADVFTPVVDQPVPAVLAWSPYGKQGGFWSYDIFPGRAGVAAEAVSGLQKFEGPDPAFWCAAGYAWSTWTPAGLSPPRATSSSGPARRRRTATTSWSGSPHSRGAPTPWRWRATPGWRSRSGSSPPSDHRTWPRSHRGRGSPTPTGTSSPGAVSRTSPSRPCSSPTTSAATGSRTSPRWPKRTRSWTTTGAARRWTSRRSPSPPTWSPVGPIRSTCAAPSTPSPAWTRPAPGSGCTNTHEWPDNYTHGADLRAFFDHVVEGADNGWADTPRVRLSVPDPGAEDVVDRPEPDWPLARARETALHLDAASGRLRREPAAVTSSTEYPAGTGVATFDLAFDEDTELSGPISLRLWVETDGADDADLFVYVHKLDAAGEPLLAQYMPGVPVTGATGRLRASHRELDEARSTALAPVHRHERERRLTPGEVVCMDIPIWPVGMQWHAGQQLRLVISGHDLTPPPNPGQPPNPNRNRGVHGCTPAARTTLASWSRSSRGAPNLRPDRRRGRRSRPRGHLAQPLDPTARPAGALLPRRPPHDRAAERHARGAAPRRRRLLVTAAGRQGAARPPDARPRSRRDVRGPWCALAEGPSHPDR